jgi:tetratricopeptide (TPR) repeat protein
MCSDPTQAGHQDALELWQRGYIRQAANDFEGAAQLYAESVRRHPTAEAWTFLGWLASIRGDYHEAIEHCERAISVDPTFGNPYNDIGAYLLELGQLDEAIPWLEKATRAPRYEAPHYPFFNLGRVYIAKEMYSRAIEQFEHALEVKPDYEIAQRAIRALKLKLN